MNILHISPSYYPATKYGGPIFSVHALNKALHENSINICVITTNAGIDRICLNVWHKYDNINIKYIKYYGYEHFNFSPKMVLELFRLINKFDIVTMSSVWNFTTLIGALISILFNKPYIIFPHGALSKYSISMKSTFKKYLYYLLVMKFILRKATKIRYTSSHECETSILSNANKSHYVIIPHGLDIHSRVEYGERSVLVNVYPNKYILFMGRLHTIKGLDILMRAFKKIADKYKDVYLIIAGSEINCTGLIKDFSEANNIADKVIFTGFVSRQLKGELVRNAMMLVMPSYFENFGMAAIEAMSLKTPVVISNKVGICHEIGKHNAGIVVETTTDSLYHGISLLIKNDSLRRQLVANGYKLVREKYDIDKVAVQMIDLYKAIIN